MMVTKGSGSLFILGLAVAALAHPADASSYAVEKPTFSPRSHIASPKNEEALLSKPFDATQSQLLASSRGGGVSANQNDAIVAALTFMAIERVSKELFSKYDISFPWPLGACIILLVFMVVGEVVIPGVGDSVFSFLNPGAILLTKWLPSFFVPGLAMLPLAPSIGSSVEVAKVLSVVILGFVFTLSSTAFTVLGLRTAMGAVKPSRSGKSSRASRGRKGSSEPKAFADETMDFLIKGAVLSGAISIAATRADFEWATPLRTVNLIFVTVASYVYGARLPASFTKLVHPLVTSTALTTLAMTFVGLVTDSPFKDVLRTFKVGSLNPLEAGAGDFLLYMLGPTVVSFSTSMYSKKTLIKDNLLIVVAAVLVSSLGGLFGTGAFVRLIKLGGDGDNFLRRSVLSRNVTTALAIALTTMIEGDIAIAASVVVMTGIIGATFGRTLLSAMGVEDSVSRGLGIGAAAQGLGVQSIRSEEDAFPFGAVAMILNAVCATTLVSIPAVKNALLTLIGAS